MWRDTLKAFLREQDGEFDETQWHEWVIYWFSRDIWGRRIIGDVWRKLGPNGWEYQQRKESSKEFFERMSRVPVDKSKPG